MSKFSYFLNSAAKWLSGRGVECPSCRDRRSTVISRKFLVTSLRRCSGCRLLYRTPTTTAESSVLSYQTQYTQGFTTECPTETVLAEMKATLFRNTEKDYSKYIHILQRVGVSLGARVYDFGCSWGYGSFQLSAAGYRVDSFDISAPRFNYAQKHLGVNPVLPMSAESCGYDVFFSSHVIEHVPSVNEMIELAMRVLKPGGIMVTLTPNGGDLFRKSHPKKWRSLWGEVHPQLLDVEYIKSRFPTETLLIADSSVSELILAGFGSVRVIDIPAEDVELLFIVRRPSLLTD